MQSRKWIDQAVLWKVGGPAEQAIKVEEATGLLATRYAPRALSRIRVGVERRSRVAAQVWPYQTLVTAPIDYIEQNREQMLVHAGC
jgi:hypothetical protein